MAQVYNIPAARPFLRDLAAGILRQAEETGTPLPRFLIMLPNRRSCRDLRNMFLELSGGRPVLLPAIRPLGDVDAEELSFSLAPELAAELADMPPAMESLSRQILLARLVQKATPADAPRSMEQALLLAQALGILLDQVAIESLSFDRLKELVPEEHARHWQLSIDFLQILSVHWPEILKVHGRIDAAERRNRMLDLLARHWRDAPPEHPVIAAGSTGSIPATARLLSVIKDLPRGAVVLPGLDQELDETSWEALGETHPQKTLKTLLQQFGHARHDVMLWPDSARGSAQSGFHVREFLARELMRPAETAENWTHLQLTAEQHDTVLRDLRNVTRYEAASAEQEAMIIALTLRATLEDPEKTAALVTPDRILAARVKQLCRRWEIALDDSAGEPLHHTATGILLRLAIEAALYPAQASRILSLLKHPLCGCGLSRRQKEREVRLADKGLRGSSRAAWAERLPQGPVRDALQDAAAEFVVLGSAVPVPAREMIEAHLGLLEKLCADDQGTGAARLWGGEGGEQAAAFFGRLLEQAATLPDLRGGDYLEMLQILMRGITVRPAYGTHPRLHILGQIEARLVQYDVMILSGLNEGVWPPAPAADPWMSRPMRAAFGLPDTEKSIGQSAHDFVQAFAAKEVVLTRARTIDGTPGVPARWLQRLDAVLRAVDIDPQSLHNGTLDLIAARLDRPEGLVSAAVPPRPCPPVAARPVTFSVTAIERWMRDPYSFYARHILKLYPMEELEQDADAAIYGSWLHGLLKWYVETFDPVIPHDALQQLLEKAAADPDAPADAALWMPRFERLAAWFVAHDRNWRSGGVRNRLREAGGGVTLGAMTLEAKADRIDMLPEGVAAIIDYKTGTLPSKKDIADGLSPQLPLEAVILEGGGFDGIEAVPGETLLYWKLSGGAEAGLAQEAGSAKMPAAQLIEEARAGVQHLFAVFQDEDVPYLSLPDPQAAPKYRDYDHLARVKEWAALDEGDAEDAA